MTNNPNVSLIQELEEAHKTLEEMNQIYGFEKAMAIVCQHEAEQSAGNPDKLSNKLIETIKELSAALENARAIILEDLGTEIESIENALENSKEYKNG